MRLLCSDRGCRGRRGSERTQSVTLTSGNFKNLTHCQYHFRPSAFRSPRQALSATPRAYAPQSLDVAGTNCPLLKVTSVPIPDHATHHAPPIYANRTWLAANRRRLCRSCVLPELSDVAHLLRDARRTPQPTSRCRVAQGDLSWRVAEMILPERVVVRFAAVFAAPRTLDKVKYLLIEPVAFVPVRRFVTLPPKRTGFVVASTSTKMMLRAISLIRY